MSVPAPEHAPSWTRTQAQHMLRITRDRARLADGLGMRDQAVDQATEALRLVTWLDSGADRVPLQGWPS